MSSKSNYKPYLIYSISYQCCGNAGGYGILFNPNVPHTVIDHFLSITDDALFDPDKPCIVFPSYSFDNVIYLADLLCGHNVDDPDIEAILRACPKSLATDAGTQTSLF